MCSQKHSDSSQWQKTLSPSPDTCRQAILRHPVCVLCFLPCGEVLKSGVGTTVWIPT